jgi:hypothetical protein
MILSVLPGVEGPTSTLPITLTVLIGFNVATFVERIAKVLRARLSK